MTQIPVASFVEIDDCAIIWYAYTNNVQVWRQWYRDLGPKWDSILLPKPRQLKLATNTALVSLPLLSGSSENCHSDGNFNLHPL